MIFCSEYKVLPHQSAAELNFLVVFNPVNFKHNFLLKNEKESVSWLTAVGCSGWMYVTTPETAHRLSQAAQGASFFWIDDVWVGVTEISFENC